MKAKQLFFIVLPLALAASSALMPGLADQALHRKIIGLNLPFFEIADDETNNKPLVSLEGQQKLMPKSPEDESAETRFSENLSTLPDATGEKITPDMFAMLFDSKAEVGLPALVSKNPGQNKSKAQRQSSAHFPAGSAPRFGAMPKPVIMGGAPSGPLLRPGSGTSDVGAVADSAEPERPWEIVSDPIEQSLILDPNEDLGLENSETLFGGPLTGSPIIVGFSSPSGGNAGALDPNSPLNPLPPLGDAVNPFATPELTSGENQFPRPNPRAARPFQFPRPGDRTVPTQTATAAPVPEPGTMILMGVGLVVLIFYRRRFRKS